jgi:hypothetical protein
MGPSQLVLFTTTLSLWLYSPLNISRFFSFLILYTDGRTPCIGDQPVAHKHRINAQRHPYLEWDSNPRSQYSSGRIRFMPETARPATVIKSMWMRWVGYVAQMVIRKCVQMFNRKTWRAETARTSKWENNIEMHLNANSCEGVDWIYLAQDRVRRWDAVNMVMHPEVQ